MRFKLICLAILSVGLGACQAMPTAQNQAQKSLTQPATSSAKQLLKSAIQAQARRNFSYQSDIVLDNSARLTALQNTPSDVLDNADESMRCENEHEMAYIALMTQKSIMPDDFLASLDKLKQDFLACQQTYQSLDDKIGFDEPDGLDELADLDKLDDTDSDVLNTKSNAGDYDTMHTALDLKKNQLLQAYLLDSLDVRVVGNYRPLVGTLTLLPTAQYTIKNAKFMVNQPIIIDAHAQMIYLWADNLALANSMYLDDKLGTAWQNKWLKLPINDGTLPNTFAKDLLQTFVSAKSQVFDNADISFIGRDELNTLIDSKIRHKLSAVSHIIQVKKQRSSDLSALIFYDEMTQKYPQLIDDSSHDKLTSLAIMQKLFAMLDKNNHIAKDTDSYQFYGVTGNKIVWQVSESTLPYDKNPANEPLKIYQVTQFNDRLISDFDRLPSLHQKPNAQNTVNLFDYSNALTERLKTSDNVINQTVASILLQVLGVDLSNQSEQMP